MTKGLEIIKNKLTDLEDEYQHYKMTEKDVVKARWIEYDIEDLKIVEKELKALEIIKEKKVNTWILVICNNVDVYNASIPNDMMKQLTLNEFVLLKEIVKNDTI